MKIFNKIKYSFQKLSRINSTNGFLRAAVFLSGRLLIRKWDSVIYEFDLNKNLTNKWISYENFAWWDVNSIKSMDEKFLFSLDKNTRWEFLESVKNGNFAYTVTKNGKIAHYGIVMLRSRQNSILGESFRTPLIGYCYTHPAYRRKGLYTIGLCAAINEIRKLGHQRVIIETHPNNQYSKLGITKAGFFLSKKINGFILINRICLFNVKTKRNTKVSLWLNRE